jgi:hypothetical protein
MWGGRERRLYEVRKKDKGKNIKKINLNKKGEGDEEKKLQD